MNIHEVKRSNGVTRLYSVHIGCGFSPSVNNVRYLIDILRANIDGCPSRLLLTRDI